MREREKWKMPGNFPRYRGVWAELEDGGGDRWLYGAQRGLVFIFIQIQDMVAACGRDASHWFCADVAVVDLASSGPETVVKALRYAGVDLDDLAAAPSPLRLIQTACACHDYGAKAPMWSEEAVEVKDRFDSPGERHPGFRKLRSDARKFAESLFEENARETMLDTRIVNKIGQSARSYMQGDLWGALRSIRDNANATPEQRLILKMYAQAGQTLGAGPVPADLLDSE